tara:strand:- start:12109 stop:13329 length:1221 start_codon:yes stop_codon:yes gene_type:complete
MLSFEPPVTWLENLTAEQFSSISHRIIYAAVQTEIQNKKTTTPQGVVEKLRKEASLQTAGGEDYIYEIIESCNDIIVDAPETKDIIINHHRLRQIGVTANAALRAAFGAEGDLAAAENRTRDLLNLLESRKTDPSLVSSALNGVLVGAKETFRPAVKTGWGKLDQVVRLSPGRLIVLGARPGVGKTTLATQLSAQILTQDEEAHVLYCSVEMDSSEIGLKALSMMTGTNCVHPFQESDAKEIEHVLWRAGHHSQVLDRLHVFYGSRLDKLVNVANKMSSELNLKMVVCDFITSMQPIGDHGTRTEAIGSVSKALKALAKQLSIPVLACSQLNRSGAVGKRPSMKDLRDSGEIEQDADIILLMHSREAEENTEDFYTDLIIEKNRFGVQSEFALRPQFNFHRFSMFV